MPLNATEQAALDRLKLYNSGNYNASSNPRGLGNAGAPLNFPQSLKDVATATEGVAQRYDAIVALASLAVATVAELFANTASRLLSVNALWAAQEPILLTDGSSIAVDLSSGINFKVTLAGNRTLAVPTSAKRGQSGIIEVYQDGAGVRTLDYSAAWDFGAAGKPTLSAGTTKPDLITYYVLDASAPVVRASFSKAA